MTIFDELYCAMVEVGACARRNKIPGPLRTLIDTAQKLLDLWRRHERAAIRFASMVLARPTNLRATTGQLPEPTRTACWRLISLLECIASLDDGGKETAHQATDGESAR